MVRVGAGQHGRGQAGRVAEGPGQDGQQFGRARPEAVDGVLQGRPQAGPPAEEADYPGAARDLQEALGIYEDIGDRHGRAMALVLLGNGRRMAGDYLGALSDLQEAAGICRDFGDRRGQAWRPLDKGRLAWTMARKSLGAFRLG
jgi:tetratricopeptide (TPR) repeat protein